MQKLYNQWADSGKPHNSPVHNALAQRLLKLAEIMATRKFIKNTLLHREAIGDANLVIAQVIDSYRPEDGSSLKTYAMLRISGSFQDTARRLDTRGRTLRKAITMYESLREENIPYAELKNRMAEDFKEETIREAEGFVYSEAQESPGQFVDPTQNTLESVHKEWLHNEFAKVVNTLPDNQKSVLSMMWAGGNNKEIAEGLGVSPSAITIRTKKACATLRDRLERRGLTFEAF